MKLKYYMRGLGAGILFSVAVMMITGSSNPKMSDQEIISAARKLGMVEADAKDDVNLSALTPTPLPDNTLATVTPQPEKDNVGTDNTSENGLNDEDKDSTSENGLNDEDKDNTSGNGLNDEDESVASLPTATPGPTAASSPTVTPAPTEASSPTATPAPTATPSPTATPAPTATPVPTSTPAPQPTSTPKPTKAPESSDTSSDEEYVILKVTAGMWSQDVAKEAKRLGLVDDEYTFNKYMTDNGYASRIHINEYKIKKGTSLAEIAKIITTYP